jgi:DNA-binding NtrC family response regulator
MTDVLKSLAAVPIEDLLALASEKLKSMTLGELATILSGGKPSVTSTEQVAEMILALPENGSKIDIVVDALILHSLKVSDGNASAAARLMGMSRKALARKFARAKRRAK